MQDYEPVIEKEIGGLKQWINSEFVGKKNKKADINNQSIAFLTINFY